MPTESLKQNLETIEFEEKWIERAQRLELELAQKRVCDLTRVIALV